MKTTATEQTYLQYFIQGLPNITVLAFCAGGYFLVGEGMMHIVRWLASHLIRKGQSPPDAKVRLEAQKGQLVENSCCVCRKDHSDIH